MLLERAQSFRFSAWWSFITMFTREKQPSSVALESSAMSIRYRSTTTRKSQSSRSKRRSGRHQKISRNGRKNTLSERMTTSLDMTLILKDGMLFSAPMIKRIRQGFRSLLMFARLTQRTQTFRPSALDSS